MNERRLVHFAGRVQGVGFRARTEHLARKFAVVGYVRNLANGEVELLVEGENTELDRFIAAIKTMMARNIQGCVAETLPAKGDYSNFTIA